MELWLSIDIQRRREELLRQAADARILRALESGRSSKIRARIADSAQVLSDLLADLARVMRSEET
jgi:hypothetical protein